MYLQDYSLLLEDSLGKVLILLNDYNICKFANLQCGNVQAYKSMKYFACENKW